ncbi:hypothetical protein [Vibrio sp. FF145]|uniref:hypothetical protein n=1 Tax=Vibrio sp. FF145 TaxID=3230013 RepID=UPI00352C605F
MKQLKIGFVILSIGIGLLLCLTYFPMAPSTGKTTEATVISNTLTQSLDGHRRYLTVEMVNDEFSEGTKTGIFRVTIPPTTDCPIDSIVTLDTLTNQITKQNSYQFIRCRTAQ